MAEGAFTSTWKLRFSDRATRTTSSAWIGRRSSGRVASDGDRSRRPGRAIGQTAGAAAGRRW